MVAYKKSEIKVLKKLTLTLVSLLAITSPVLAQGIEKKPANTQDILKYRYIAGLNVCILTQQGVAFKTAFPASNVLMTLTLMQLHGGEIIDGSKTLKLSSQQLENNNVPIIASAVDGLCGKELKGENKAEFDKLKDQILSAIKSAKQK